MIQFYSPDIEKELTLPQSDSQHCCRVLRMRQGDEISVVDGHGNRFGCVITDCDPRKTKIEIISREVVPLVWDNFITIMIAPTKNMDRMEWVVEKLVEIGVNRIVPIKCRYSERKEIKRERLEKIAVSAMKQSLKTTLPEICEMTPLKTAVDLYKAPQLFVGYCDADTPKTLLSKTYKANIDVNILIGPEGDFSPEEIKMLVDKNYVPVTMGDNRLRTETAALVGVTTCHIVNQINS